VRDLRGGAARAPFGLDGGDLRVTPPAAGDRPAVPAIQAECAALASLASNGGSLGGAALQSGIAMGYGRVTVSPALLAASRDTPQDVSGYAPHLPVAAPYQGRLSWIVVVTQILAVDCPAIVITPGQPPAKAPTIPATDYGYSVFLLDARTGGDALLYTEGYRTPCGGKGQVPPSVMVPAEQVSVPWTLGKRNPDGYSATISATVLPCDGYSGPILVDQKAPVAAVIVTRPVDPACGAPEQVTLSLHAATVSSDLPATIGHAPVGLVIPQPAASPPSVATPPSSHLRTLTVSDSGRTVHIGVGTVLVIPVLFGTRPTSPSPVVSSDTAVLGPLDGPNRGPVAELRAWKPGTAEVSIPQGHCHVVPSGPPCTAPWVVHVVVTGGGGG
jgi:hypothetical protein